MITISEQEFNEIFSKQLKKQLSFHEMTQSDLAKLLGVSTQSVSNWCKGTKSPRMDKVDSMCKIFNCRRSDLIEDKKEPSTEEQYYLDPDARDMAQFLFENPEYKVLFDASRKVKKEDIEFVKKMLDLVRGDSDDTGC